MGVAEKGLLADNGAGAGGQLDGQAKTRSGPSAASGTGGPPAGWMRGQRDLGFSSF